MYVAPIDLHPYEEQILPSFQQVPSCLFPVDPLLYPEANTFLIFKTVGLVLSNIVLHGTVYPFMFSLFCSA